MALKSAKNDALSGAIPTPKEIIWRKKVLSPPKKAPITTLPCGEFVDWCITLSPRLRTSEFTKELPGGK